jgi:hypothetical protein
VPAAPLCIKPSRQAGISLIETRTECIREREAHSCAPSKLCSQRPGLRKDPGLFRFWLQPAYALARPAIDGSHHRLRWTLFNKLPQGSLGTGRRHALHLCGCSSAGRARPRHGRGHEFEARHPLHFGCVFSLCGCVTWCWQCGMCEAVGQATCSETPHPTGCSRLGTAEVDSLALVAQQAEQPPCKRQAARSNRRRGHQTLSRVRLDGPGHHSFKVGTRVRIPHAMPEQGAFVELTLRGRKSTATIGRRGTRDRMDFPLGV